MIDYKDPTVLGKIMKKVVELRLRYYIDGDGVVQTYYNGTWWDWESVLKRDPRMAT